MAAALSTRSPFVAPLDKRDAADEAKRQFAGSGSDLLAVQAAYAGWVQARREGGKYAPHAHISSPLCNLPSLHACVRVCVAGGRETTAHMLVSRRVVHAEAGADERAREGVGEQASAP